MIFTFYFPLHFPLPFSLYLCAFLLCSHLFVQLVKNWDFRFLSGPNIDLLSGRIYPSVLPGETVRVIKGEEAQQYEKAIIISVLLPRKRRHINDSPDTPSYYQVHHLLANLQSFPTNYWTEMHFEDSQRQFFEIDRIMQEKVPDVLGQIWTSRIADFGSRGFDFDALDRGIRLSKKN